MESCGEGESLGAGVNQPEDPWEVRERLIVYQPEHLWEVAERLLHRLVLRSPKEKLEILRAYGEGRESLGAGVNQPEDPWEVRERLIVYQPEHLWEVTERLLHRLVLRTPKATLEILRAYGEDPFRAIFGLEVDCGKLWRRDQPEDPREVRERLIVYQPEHLWEVTERLLHRLVLRSPKATLEILRVRGGPLQGDFWSRIRLWKAVARGNHWEQVSTSQRTRGR